MLPYKIKIFKMLNKLQQNNQDCLHKENIDREKKDLLTQMEKEKKKLKHETFEKQNIENQKRELLIQMEKQEMELIHNNDLVETLNINENFYKN
jgi:hypothetical protein